MNKDKIQKRLIEIFERLEAINEIAEARDDKGIFTDAEQREWDSLISEYDTKKNEFEPLRSATCKTLEDIRANMKLPINELHKNPVTGQLINENGEEIRTFNKDNLSELRSYILSQGKLGMGNEQLSLGRAIRAIATGNWGKFAPAEARALGTATGGGQWFVPEELSAAVIQMALAKARIMQSGAEFLPMDKKVMLIPKISAMPVPEWTAENIGFTGSHDMTFTGITLSAKSVVSIISLSIELAEDGVGVSKSIEAALSTAIAQAIDKACLNGIGTLEPLGIALTPDILTEEFETSIDYSTLSAAYFKLQQENIDGNSLIMASSLFATLDALVDLEGQPVKPPPSYEKYAKLSSNQLVAQGIMGNYKNLIIGMRTNMNIEVSRTAESALTKMQVLIRAYSRMDCGIKLPKAFCLIKVAVA
ncbi:phage major capsid protein [Candidatus Atribacteria bacterium 1244-E10-H5-B2]|nr:MAG: phage major capsid protein [Candidatus Atribacteria bacterium 1244-E10-H5-B2]